MDTTDTHDRFESALERAISLASKETHFAEHAEKVIAAFTASMMASGYQFKLTSEIEHLVAKIAMQKEALDWYRRNSDGDFMGDL